MAAVAVMAGGLWLMWTVAGWLAPVLGASTAVVFVLLLLVGGGGRR